jgi:hypothetical protein
MSTIATEWNQQRYFPLLDLQSADGQRSFLCQLHQDGLRVDFADSAPSPCRRGCSWSNGQ